MSQIRKMQIALLCLSLLLGAFAFYFYLRAAETSAQADDLREEGARIHAEAAAEKAIEPNKPTPPSE